MTELRRWTPSTLLDMRFISDPQMSPDGTKIAYVESWIEEVEDTPTRPGYRSAIFIIDAAGGVPHRVTYSVTGRDAAPRWSPDGTKLAFLSTRDENLQLYLLDLTYGGEARQLTNLAYGVAEANWRPDGRALTFISRGDKDKDHKRVEKLRDEQIIERLPFKADGVGYLQPEYAHIWMVDLDSPPRQLSVEDFDHAEPTWSPDGQEIAFISVSRAELEHTRIADVYVLNLADNTSRCLTNSVGPAYHPAWSPDGSAIAYIGHDNHIGNASNEALWVVSRTGGDARLLSQGFEYGLEDSVGSDSRLGRFPYSPVWTSAGIYFIATRAARTRLYCFKNGEIVQLSADDAPTIAGFTHRGGSTAFIAETQTRTSRLYSRDAAGVVRLLVDPNVLLLAQLKTLEPEHVKFNGADGLPLEGWYLKPANVEPGKRYPLVLYIHGGPHAAYGYGFFHEFQMLAAAGIGVFYTNPRGGTGYGQEFRAMVRQDFGGNDYLDLMQAADLAETWDWVDSSKMGVAGGSYGGYMTNWIISHTDRFAAANTQRCLSNLTSFYGTSDIGPYFGEDEFGGKPWTNIDKFLERSPLRYVDKINTPLLILHSDEDHRCPVEQAEQLYTSLKILEKTVRFVRFPREGHDLSRSGEPLHRIARIEYILDWFGHYLLGQELKAADMFRRTVAADWAAKE